jgi:hypothetical protein
MMRASRFVAAAAVSALVILWAPFISQVRSGIQKAFPGQFVAIVGAVVGISIAAALIVAVARIRERRALRYGAMLAAVALGATYAFATRSGIPEVDAVERFHFVEFGLITLLFYRAWRPLGDGSIFVLPVLAGVLVGTLEEWFQWFIPVRVGEVKDVFLNCAAIASGLLFSIGVEPPASFAVSIRPGSRRGIGLLGAAVVLVFAMFFQSVHLGYEIADEDAAFRSRYSAGHLAALSAERAERWKRDPPARLRRLSREDQYMTEGVTHVQERNEMWAAGDRVAAWKENRILEKYYAPVLDTPSYVSRTGHRWPAEQRADAEATVARTPAADHPRAYASAAHPSPIYTWPKPLFWAVVAVLMGAIAIPAALVGRRGQASRDRATVDAVNRRT